LNFHAYEISAMFQDGEAAVYHRDKRLDAIWRVCATNFVAESTAVPLILLSQSGHESICTYTGRGELWVTWRPARGSGLFLDPY
jgi:hypothetical protein